MPPPGNLIFGMENLYFLTILHSSAPCEVCSVIIVLLIVCQFVPNKRLSRPSLHGVNPALGVKRLKKNSQSQQTPEQNRCQHQRIEHPDVNKGEQHIGQVWCRRRTGPEDANTAEVGGQHPAKKQEMAGGLTVFRPIPTITA